MAAAASTSCTSCPGSCVAIAMAVGVVAMAVGTAAATGPETQSWRAWFFGSVHCDGR